MMFKDNCPICKSKITHNEKENRHLYSCKECMNYHYYDYDNGVDPYIVFHVTETYVMLVSLGKEPYSIAHLTDGKSSDELFEYKGIFPINWDDMEATAKRIKRCIPFS